jgi:cytochrome oxidase Cu insertion factor (SCO1/SenC/PrrC family)
MRARAIATLVGIACSAVIASGLCADVGDEAPLFELLDTDGEAVALADYRGRPTAVVFYRGFF